MSDLRNILIAQRNHLAEHDVLAGSRAVCHHLEDYFKKNHVRNVAIYFSIGNEIDLRHLFPLLNRLSIQLYAPKATSDPMTPYSIAPFGGRHPSETRIGQFSIEEPSSDAIPYPTINQIVDTWLVPGVGFTRSGNRIGFGGGYYDRLLAHASAPKIGVAYDWQICESLPHHHNDIPMDLVVTPSTLIRCSDYRT